MIANNIFIALLMTVTFCFSQTKDDDVYFIVDTNNKEYIVAGFGEGDPFKEYMKSIENLRRGNFNFDFISIEEFNAREKEEPGGGELSYSDPYPLEFSVRMLSYYPPPIKYVTPEEVTIEELGSVHFVDFKWLDKYSGWSQKAGDKALFKRLYFLYKFDDNKYMKYDVERTFTAR